MGRAPSNRTMPENRKRCRRPGRRQVAAPGRCYDRPAMGWTGASKQARRDRRDRARFARMRAGEIVYGKRRLRPRCPRCEGMAHARPAGGCPVCDEPFVAERLRSPVATPGCALAGAI